MIIVYYSTPWFLDCDLPLVKAMMEQGHTVYYLLSVNPSSTCATILNNCKLFDDYAIHHSSDYECLTVFREYMNMDNFFVINYPNDRLTSFSELIQSWKLHKKVISLIRRLSPDIYHVSGIQRTFGYYKARSFKNILVCTMHDPIPHDVSVVSKHMYRTAKKFFRLPKKIVLLNNQQTDAFCQRYKVESDRISYSRLGVYECTSLFASDKNNRDFKYILFFGRIQKYKGVELLIRAMRIVHTVCPELKLVIAGKGAINETWDESYVEVNNRFIKPDELATLLKYCEFSVCPYLSATQSGVVTTAFSMEVPVVATNVGGIKESICHRKTGLLVEPNDEQILADAIIQLYKDGDLRKQLVKNIQSANSVGPLSWKEISCIYTNIYRNI